MSGPGAGQVLGERYRLTERIAGGGMGEVWKADDTVLGRPVAVKVLRHAYADDPTFLARFRNEARSAAALSHPGIAAVYDFGEGDRDGGGSPYLVMEYVPGEPLSSVVSREGALTPERTLHVVGRAALGLEAAHDAGVIHRDVKPGNILVTPDGDVKLTDFGIARAANAVPLTQTGAIMGTAFYISPEQASGRSVTPASDVYSLGVVAYECLTGRRPFNGDTPVSVALAQVSQEPPALPADIPGPVRELVMRMLAKDPQTRPSDAGEVGREALALVPAVVGAASAHPAATRVLPTMGGASAAAGPVDVDTDPPGSAGTTTVVTPAGGPDTDPGFRLPDPSRLPHWTPYAVLLVIAAVVLLLVVKACGADPEGSTPRQPTDQSSATTQTVDVVASDYVGRPVDDVTADLRGLGLDVRVTSSGGGGQVGTVRTVSPTGTLAAGSTVTVEVVQEAPKPQDKPGKGKGRKKGDE